MPVSESSDSSLKLKSSLVKDQNNSKTEKNKKESEIKEEHFCNPWDLIWPKENSKPFNLPVINLSGKYAVKLFWMVWFVHYYNNTLMVLKFASRNLWMFKK